MVSSGIRTPVALPSEGGRRENTYSILIHSFLTVKGTRKEFGITSVKKVVLSGMGRQAKPMSVDPTELFKAKEHPHHSYYSIFLAKSTEELMAIGPKDGT
jgi:hypothetical protein